MKGDLTLSFVLGVDVTSVNVDIITVDGFVRAATPCRSTVIQWQDFLQQHGTYSKRFN